MPPATRLCVSQWGRSQGAGSSWLMNVINRKGWNRMNERMPEGKSHVIPRQVVWEAWLKVKKNGGAAGVDGRAGVKVGGRGFCCMSRFDVFSGLQAEQVEGLQAGAVPGEVAAGCGVVRQAGTVQDTDDSAGNGGEQPGGAAGPQPGGVFGVCGIASQVDWASHCSFTAWGWLEQPVLGGG